MSCIICFCHRNRWSCHKTSFSFNIFIYVIYIIFHEPGQKSHGDDCQLVWFVSRSNNLIINQLWFYYTMTPLNKRENCSFGTNVVKIISNLFGDGEQYYMLNFKLRIKFFMHWVTSYQIDHLITLQIIPNHKIFVSSSFDTDFHSVTIQ